MGVGDEAGAAVSAADGAASKEEKFGWVEAGFVVDVDVGCEVGGFLVVCPPFVFAPGAELREEDFVAWDGGIGEDVVACCEEEVAGLCGVFTVEGAELVVAEGEGGGLVEVWVGAAADGAGAEESGLAEDDVRSDGGEGDIVDIVVAHDFEGARLARDKLCEA